MYDLGIIYKQFFVISDLHLGINSSTISNIVLKEMISRVRSVIEKFNIKTVIINGDLKHSINILKPYELEHVKTFLNKIDSNVILIKGNHDAILDKHIPMLNEYKIDNVIITHGHKIINAKKGFYILGHAHPYIKIRDEIGSIARFKVFIKHKDFIILPTYNPIIWGEDIFTKQLIIPNIQEKLNDSDIFIAHENEYALKIGRFKHIYSSKKSSI